MTKDHPLSLYEASALAVNGGYPKQDKYTDFELTFEFREFEYRTWIESHLSDRAQHLADIHFECTIAISLNYDSQMYLNVKSLFNLNKRKKILLKGIGNCTGHWFDHVNRTFGRGLGITRIL